MKQYIFLKTSPSIQLAHLYEHITCMQLSQFLIGKGLYQYIDYDLVGKTYYGGLVYIEISLYSGTRVDVSRHLQNLKIDFSEQLVTIGLSQLIAEKGSSFGAKSLDAIQTALTDLHNKKWQSIDAFDLLDARTIRRNSKGLYIADNKNRRQRTLTFSIRPKDGLKIDNELLPLARQVYKTVATNLSTILADTYGYFSIEDTFKANRTGCVLTTKLSLGETAEQEVDTYLEIARTLTKELIARGAVKRFLTQLRSMSYINRPDETVNFESTYEATLIFIGSKGWRRIATIGNIEQLLNNTIIEFKVSGHKASAKIL